MTEDEWMSDNVRREGIYIFLLNDEITVAPVRD
jgi:hypothetical protein